MCIGEMVIWIFAVLVGVSLLIAFLCPKYSRQIEFENKENVNVPKYKKIFFVQAATLFIFGSVITIIMISVDLFLANSEEIRKEITKTYQIKELISNSLLSVDGSEELANVYVFETVDAHILASMNPNIHENDKEFRLEESKEFYYKMIDNSKKIFFPSEDVIVKERYCVGERDYDLYIPRDRITEDYEELKKY